jgi:hypothetical protein
MYLTLWDAILGEELVFASDNPEIYSLPRALLLSLQEPETGFILS